MKPTHLARTEQPLWSGPDAGWLLAAGVAGVVAWNWQRWQHDRALAAALRERQPEPVVLHTTPRVTVLVAAWNEARGIERHVESFTRLRYPDKELVLCAGGDDRTWALAQACAGPQVVVLQQQAGEGKQRALRRCLERATGSIIFLTDADCLLDDDAFERTIAPLVSGREMVATGTIKPLPLQQTNPFVLHQWFIQIGGAVRCGDYVDGMQGANVAVDRDVLETVGGFHADVRTGTDYHLAKQILGQGYQIRHVPDSAVQTPFPETPGHYRRQHSRWLRNVVLHGLRSGNRREVVGAITPSILGILMLSGPVLSIFLGPLAVAGWLLAFLHALLSRVRYMSFGERITGCPFPAVGYFRLPAYLAVDLITWTWTLLQYLSKRQRSQW